MKYLSLSWIDYALFILMVGLSTIVGLYFGFCGKQDTAADYLQGGKTMKIFPVGMSLVASTLSGMALLAIPAEVYMHGTQYWMMAVSIFFLGFAVNYIYLPVFYKLQLISVFEYLEIRFNKTMRTITSILFTVVNLLTLPIIIYTPSLAFNQVTGFNIYIIAPIMTSICVFYTSLGGLKAVVWTDTLQFCITLCTLGCVLVMGTISVGGLGNIWEKARQGDRLEFFNMDLDPTLRNSFWSVVLGNLFIWTYFIGVNPGIVQRFLAVPTINHARKILIVFVIFTILTKSINCFSGLIIYAKYMDCDPLTSGYMKKADQIVPLYVLDVAGEVYGLSGLFIAGLFSTTLSTLSTFLNSLAGTAYEDFIAPFMPSDTSEKKASTIMKIVTLILGSICVALIFIVEKLGSLLQLVHSVAGITGGPVFGAFTLGMLVPFANEKGALCGTLGSTLVMSIIVIQNQIYIWNGAIKPVPKPLYTYGCNDTSVDSSVLNTTLTTSLKPDTAFEEPNWLFRISFYYYLLIGTLLTIIIGALVSWITEHSESSEVNLDLLSPCVHRFVSKGYSRPSNVAGEIIYELQEFQTNKYDKKEVTETLKE